MEKGIGKVVQFCKLVTIFLHIMGQNRYPG